jgi:hypothetical protein
VLAKRLVHVMHDYSAGVDKARFEVFTAMKIQVMVLLAYTKFYIGSLPEFVGGISLRSV